MADGTITYAVDNSQDWPVIAQNYCQRIVVQENYNSTTPPTADLLQKIPASAVSAVAIAKGTPAVYTPLGREYFRPGEKVGTIRTVSGSITAQQIESRQV